MLALLLTGAIVSSAPTAQEKPLPAPTPSMLSNIAPLQPRPDTVGGTSEPTRSVSDLSAGAPDPGESEQTALPLKLQETGDGFHGDQVNAATGQIWLGLFNRGNDFYLRRTKVAVSMVNDPIVDDESEKTGKSVATAIHDKSVFLLKKADFLREGPVKTVFFAPDTDESTELANGTIKRFAFGGRDYELAVSNDVSKEKFLVAGSKLLLKDGSKVQILRNLKDGCDDCSWNLYWAGDLDRDGKLDLYLDLTDHYNTIDKRLFLSSRAEAGEIVKYVANFWTNGC
jgi:hypothetical protein